MRGRRGAAGFRATPPSGHRIELSLIHILETSNPDVTHQYTFGFQLKKTDGAGALLAGAEFELRHEETGAAIELVKGEDGAYHPKTDVDGGFMGKVVTDDTGIIKFKGLAAGTYYLVETKAPEGFNKLAKPIKITIDDTTSDVNAPSWLSLIHI